MKKVKYLIFCLISLLMLSVSCNKKETEPIYIPLSIKQTFETEMKEFNISHIEDWSPINDTVKIINSLSELPADEIFGNEEFLSVDFSQHSLIIVYDVQFGKVMSARYRWGYNNYFEQYDVNINYEVIKDSQCIDGEITFATFIRGAILVDRIPSDSEIIATIGVTWIDHE